MLTVNPCYPVQMCGAVCRESASRMSDVSYLMLRRPFRQLCPPKVVFPCKLCSSNPLAVSSGTNSHAACLQDKD
jgi:hypothetical protein